MMSPKKRPVSSPPPPDGPPYVNEFLDYLQAECGLANNTRLAYRRDLVHFFACLDQAGVKDVSSLAPRHIDGFLRYCRSIDFAASSAARALAAVRMFCRYLVIQNVLSLDVSESVESPKQWHRLPGVMSDSAARQIDSMAVARSKSR